MLNLSTQPGLTRDGIKIDGCGGSGDQLNDGLMGSKWGEEVGS